MSAMGQLDLAFKMLFSTKKEPSLFSTKKKWLIARRVQNLLFQKGRKCSKKDEGMSKGMEASVNGLPLVKWKAS
jgi:hypothetical protein